MIRRKNNNDKECSVESSLEVGMLSKSTFNDQELDNYLRQGEIKASEKPPVPPQILWVGDCTIATFGNFSASTGKAKSKKTFNITAMVAAAVNNSTVLKYRASLPDGKRKILYFPYNFFFHHRLHRFSINFLICVICGKAVSYMRSGTSMPSNPMASFTILPTFWLRARRKIFNASFSSRRMLKSW